MLQVNNTRSSHMLFLFRYAFEVYIVYISTCIYIDMKFPYAIFTPIFHLISEFEKNGVNSEHSCYKWIIPEVPICYFYSDFPFFSVNLTKNRVKSEKLSSKWNRSQVAISNLQPDFPFFFQWILEKRDKFCEIHPLGGFYPIDLP